MSGLKGAKPGTLPLASVRLHLHSLAAIPLIYMRECLVERQNSAVNQAVPKKPSHRPSEPYHFAASAQPREVPRRVDASFAEVYSETAVAEATGRRLAVIGP